MIQPCESILIPSLNNNYNTQIYNAPTSDGEEQITGAVYTMYIENKIDPTTNSCSTFL